MRLFLIFRSLELFLFSRERGVPGRSHGRGFRAAYITFAHILLAASHVATFTCKGGWEIVYGRPTLICWNTLQVPPVEA